MRQPNNGGTDRAALYLAYAGAPSRFGTSSEESNQ